MTDNYVYKFRDWEIVNHQRWLNQPELFFSSPTLLNDPFDCSIIYRYDKLSEKEQLQKYRKLIKLDYPTMNKKKILKQSKEWMSRKLISSENIFVSNENTFRDFTSNQIGVLSLTKVKDNILLWSHYSNKHTGFCLAYNKNKLEEYLKENYRTMSLVPFWFDVEYKNEYPIVIPNKNLSVRDYIEIPLKTKSILWDYEKEYRVVMMGGTNLKKAIPYDLIEEVILGCNISDDSKKEIISVIDNKKMKIPIIVSKKHKEKFELSFEVL